MKAVGLALIFTLCVFAHADTAPPSAEEWKTGKEAYTNGNFEAALKFFESAPQDNAAYYFNVGTTLLKLGRPGAAVAYLEKANRRLSHDASIQQNLKEARTALVQALGVDRLDPSSTPLESLVDRVSIDELRGLVGLLAFSFALVWLRRYRKTRSVRATLISFPGISGMICILLAGALYLANRIAESHPPAILLEHVTVRSGPGDKYLELGQLEAGVKVRLLGPSQSNEETHVLWKQVRTSADSDSLGWINANAMLDLE